MTGAGCVRPFPGGGFQADIRIGNKRKRRVFLDLKSANAWLKRMRDAKTRRREREDALKFAVKGSVVYFMGAEPIGMHPIKIGFSETSGSSRERERLTEWADNRNAEIEKEKEK